MEVNELINYIHQAGFDTKQNRGTLGRLINETIAGLSDQEIDTIALHLSQIYPKDSFASNMKNVDHVAPAIVFRTLFGSICKNGILLECTHPDRKAESDNTTNFIKTASWEKPFLFVSFLEKHFKAENNNYGLIILYEMLGHRYGDLAVLSTGEEREKNVALMEQAYLNSFQKARQIKCMKQSFSPWYWGAMYFTKLGMRDKAIEWHKKHQEMAMAYMLQDPHETYIGKITLSLKSLKELLGGNEFVDYIKGVQRRNKNKCYTKALKISLEK